MQLPSNRKFGFFFTFVFFIFSLYFYYNSFSNFYYLITISLSILTLIITLLNSNLLLPFNKGWMSIGYILGIVISPIILSIMYFILITPFGLIRQIFGKDELVLKNKKLNSYWQDREKNDKINQSFKNQF
tara:strand:- start:32 stop:421 length:390 start_codon:yes stop_codon:yes gene_type:complete